MLMDAGSSALPVLTTVNGTEQTFSQTNLGGYTNNIFTANLPPPSNFGTAAFSTSASTALANNGTGANQQGVSFNWGRRRCLGSRRRRGRSCRATLLHAVRCRLGQLPRPSTQTSPTLVTCPPTLSPARQVWRSAHGQSRLGPGELRRTCGQGGGHHQRRQGQHHWTDPYTIVVGLTFNSTLTHNTYTYTNLPTGSSGTTPTIESA